MIDHLMENVSLNLVIIVVRICGSYPFIEERSANAIFLHDPPFSFLLALLCSPFDNMTDGDLLGKTHAGTVTVRGCNVKEVSVFAINYCAHGITYVLWCCFLTCA